MSAQLEVVTAAGTHLKRGDRFDLEGAFEIGRSTSVQLQLPVGTLAQKHVRIEQREGKWLLEDMRSTNGTFVNGTRVRFTRELSHGDSIELPWGIAFRLVLDGGTPMLSLAGQEQAMALVAADVHDPGHWQVWSDRLLEHGNPLGERIAHGEVQGKLENARVLGPLARDYVEGSLEIDWWHGFVRRAVLRNVNDWPLIPWLSLWRLLLEHPLTHFVEAVEIDVLSYTRGIERLERTDAEQAIVSSLEALAAAPAFPVLRSMRFGPSPRSLWNPRLEPAWRACCAAHPLLRVEALPVWVTRRASLQLLSTPPGVTVKGLDVGAQRKLAEDEANLVGPLADIAFALETAESSPSSSVALRLDREGGLWWAEDIGAQQLRRTEVTLRVNGRETTRHRMRPGDVLEPAPGLTFRFVME